MSTDLFIPAELAHAAAAWWGRKGTQWLDRLPGRIADLEQRWSITVDRAFSPGGATSHAAPATLGDGAAGVLKLTIPHREAVREAAALRLYDGRSAVRLLAEDPDHNAVLLERCMPGTPPLEDAGAARLAIGVELLRRLWRPVPAGHAFEPLADVAAEWAEGSMRAPAPGSDTPLIEAPTSCPGRQGWPLRCAVLTSAPPAPQHSPPRQRRN
jgi:streptomycin 6-kinase